MKVGLRVTVFLGQPKINYIDLVSTFSNTHEEVVWLDVSMNEGFGVDIFNARDELIRQQKYRFQGEFAVAKVEKILQAGSEKIKNHGVVITLSSKPTNKGNTDTSSKRLVHAGFILKLWMLGLDAL